MGVKVWVKMGARLLGETPPRQHRNQFTYPMLFPTKLAIGDCTLLIGNGQRQQRAIGKDRAGDTTIAGVEAFAAQNDLHCRLLFTREQIFDFFDQKWQIGFCKTQPWGGNSITFDIRRHMFVVRIGAGK